MKRVMTRGLMSAASAVTLLLAGCGSDGGEDNSPPAATVTTAPPATTPPTTTPPTTTPPASTNVTALSQAEAVTAADAFTASRTTAFASSVPATAAARYEAHDPCYRHDGYTKAYLAQEFDKPTSLRSRASHEYLVGFTRSNQTVTATRFITNPDGTTRNEIDVEYDQTHPAEGTTTRVAQTLVNGSTTGVCPSGTNSPDTRFLGNQRVYFTEALTINQFQSNLLLTNGTAGTPPQNARRAVRFDVRDLDGSASYAVVSRQLPAGLWSIKLISPRLLATDATFTAKPGNYLSGYSVEDSFRICLTAGGSAVGVQADCTLGTTLNDLGTAIPTGFGNTTAADASTGDTAFDATLIATGDYKFEIFNDDGWKTVNGQVGKTPIASHTVTLERLPYTFAELFTGANPLTRTVVVHSLTSAQIADAFKGTADTQNQTTNGGLSAFADGRKLGRLTHFVFTQGAASTTAVGSFWPARRSIDYYFAAGPASATVTTPAYTIPGRPGDVRDRSGPQQTAQLYTDRGNSQLRFIGQWQ